jgi:hypothetical protein
MKTKKFDFNISKEKVRNSFTMVPNRLVTDLMNYLTYNELKLVLYVYQKDNDFNYNRNTIAEKFSTHKKNIDKVFSSLEEKRILIKCQQGYSLNLLVDLSDMKINKIKKSIEKTKSYHKNPKGNPVSSKPLSEVKHTSHEANYTPPDSGSEVRNTSPTEVIHTSQPNLTTASIDESLSEIKSSYNTNTNNTNWDMTKSDNYINKDNIEVNGNSIIDKIEIERLTPKSGSKNDTAKPEELRYKNENHITNSIEFLINHSPKLIDDLKATNCEPSMYSKFSDAYIATIVLSYKLQDKPQWKEVKDNLDFNLKYLGGLLFSCNSALSLQLFENVKNNLAEEIIIQSKLREEELTKLFFNLS